MIEIDTNRFRIPATPEQLQGIRHIVSGVKLADGDIRAHTALFDRPGFGKTKQIIDSASILYDNGIIDTVVVVAPKSVLSTWDEPDPEFGEIAKHSWVPYQTLRYNKDTIEIKKDKSLLWIVMSYGFLRKCVKVNKIPKYPIAEGLLKKLKDRKVFLVVDESSFIKSKDANQFKATKKLSRGVYKVSILNGTPVSQGVIDLWSQFMVLDPVILDQSFWIPGGPEGVPLTFPQFRSIFTITELKSVKGRRPFYNILGDNKEAVDKLRQRAKPWIMRRKLSGIPEKVYSHIEATLTSEQWKLYCDMRDTMVAWLKDSPSEAPNGAVKMMRLAQITSGHLGGLTEVFGDLQEDIAKVAEVGDAKQKAFLEWFETIPSDEQIIVWCRFRKELEWLQTAMGESGVSCGLIYGGQTDKQRDASKGDFQRGILRVLGCQLQAGGFGTNLQNARISVYMSNDYNYLTRDQSEERIHRRGQTREQFIIDVLAKGPNGQKTIDYEVIKALRHKEEVANWTSEAWIKALV